MLGEFIPLIVIVLVVIIGTFVKDADVALASFRYLDSIRKPITLPEYESMLWTMASEARFLKELIPIGVSSEVMATCSSYDRNPVPIVYSDDAQLNYHSSELLKKFISFEFDRLATLYKVSNTFSESVTVKHAIDKQDVIIPAADFIPILGAVKALKNKVIFTVSKCNKIASSIYYNEFTGYGLQVWSPVIRKSKEQYDLIADHLFIVATRSHLSLGTLAYMTDFYSDYIKNQFSFEEINRYLNNDVIQILLLLFNILALFHLVSSRKILLVYFALVILSNNFIVVKIVVCTFVSLYCLSQHPTDVARGWLQIQS